MDYGFSFEDIDNMSKLFGVNSEKEELENNQYYNNTGSELRPDSIGIVKSSKLNNNEEKQIAKPFAKIEQKFNNRILSKPENDIWTDKDLKEENILEDGRDKPEFEVLHKQVVGTEDVFFGMSGKDASSNSCDQLSVKIKLPNTNLKEISIEVKENSIH